MFTENEISQFQVEGVLLVKNALNIRWLDLLAKGIERNKLDRGPWSCDYTKTDDEGEFWDDYCNWQRFREYKEVLFESPLATMAREVTRSKEIRLFHEHVLVKEAHTSEKTPWHHDQPYYCVDGNQLVSSWVPLDYVSQESAMRFLSGSHKGPMYAPRRFVDHAAYEYDGFEDLPNIDEEKESSKIRSWEMNPGDVLLFHMRTLHAAGGSSTRRRAFSARWLGDDAVYAIRPGPTSPPFPELDGVMHEGDPFDHPLFPLVSRGS